MLIALIRSLSVRKLNLLRIGGIADSAFRLLVGVDLRTLKVLRRQEFWSILVLSIRLKFLQYIGRPKSRIGRIILMKSFRETSWLIPQEQPCRYDKMFNLQEILSLIELICGSQFIFLVYRRPKYVAEGSTGIKKSSRLKERLSGSLLVEKIIAWILGRERSSPRAESALLIHLRSELSNSIATSNFLWML